MSTPVVRRSARSVGAATRSAVPKGRSVSSLRCSLYRLSQYSLNCKARAATGHPSAMRQPGSVSCQTPAMQTRDHTHTRERSLTKSVAYGFTAPQRGGPWCIRESRDTLESWSQNISRRRGRTNCAPSVRCFRLRPQAVVKLPVVHRQHIEPEVTLVIPPHGVAVVADILRVVVLDQKRR